MPRKKKAPRRSPAKVAVGLVRVSSSKQEFSAQDQEARIRRWAEENGYTILRIFLDQSISGFELDRPGLRALFDYLKSCPERGVVVSWKRNRLLRKKDPRMGIVLDHKVEQLGWQCHFLEGYQRSGNVFLDTIAEVVEHHEGGKYLVNLSRDSLNAAASRIASGAPFGGKTPYGFAKRFVGQSGAVRTVPRGERHRRGPGEKGEWIPGDPMEIRVVERIFRRYATGQHSLAMIAQDLNDEAVPGPQGKPWTRYTVRGIVQNPTYQGDLVWNRATQSKFFAWRGGRATALEGEGEQGPNSEADWIRHEDHHAPLVPRDLWSRANQLLEARGRANGGARRVKGCYPLRGLVTCANCGRSMVGERMGSRQYRYRKYVCPTWSESKACFRFAIRKERLEEAVLLALKEQLGVGRDLAALEAELLGAYQRRAADQAPVWDHDALALEANQLERRLTQATQNLSLLHGAAAKGLAEQINAWSLRLEELQAQLSAPREDPLAQAREVVARAIGLLEELEELQADAAPERLRALFLATVECVDLEFGRRRTKKRHRNFLRKGKVVTRDWTGPLTGEGGVAIDLLA